jgi:prevent-host-death family protein
MYFRVYMARRRRTVADARRNLASVLRPVEKGAVVELTRRGKPVAVLLSARDYDGLTRVGGNLWGAIRDFRRDSDLARLGIEAACRDVRDRSPGRRVRV